MTKRVVQGDALHSTAVHVATCTVFYWGACVLQGGGHDAAHSVAVVTSLAGSGGTGWPAGCGGGAAVQRALRDLQAHRPALDLHLRQRSVPLYRCCTASCSISNGRSLPPFGLCHLNSVMVWWQCCASVCMWWWGVKWDLWEWWRVWARKKECQGESVRPQGGRGMEGVWRSSRRATETERENGDYYWLLKWGNCCFYYKEKVVCWHNTVFSIL